MPCILSLPGAHAETDDSLVNNALDIIPTLCRLANIPAPDGLHGHDLSGSEESAPEYIASELKLASRVEARMIRSRQYKYVAFETIAFNTFLSHFDGPGLGFFHLCVT